MDTLATTNSLRNRPNNRQLPDRISRITDCNFTARMLYRNMYWLIYILDALCFIFVYNCGLTVRNKRICYVMFSVDYCILYSECPPYFYFRFVWPTDLESIPHASTPMSIIPTKVEAPTPIRSWVMSDNVSHWLPLKMRTRPLRMRRITWPVRRGSKTITFLESPTLICLFTMHVRWLYDECN